MRIIHIQLSASSYYRGPQYHLENVSSPRFVDILSQFGLTQYVAATTHVFGDWLDVVMRRDDCETADLTIEPPSISDHGLLFTMPLLCTQPSFALRLRRGWRHLDRGFPCWPSQQTSLW